MRCWQQMIFLGSSLACIAVAVSFMILPVGSGFVEAFVCHDPMKWLQKNYRKHSACGMKFVETCYEGCLKKLPPHICEGASLT